MSSAHNYDLLLPGCLFSMEMSEFNLEDVFFSPSDNYATPIEANLFFHGF